jgi:hypothetical protein
VRRDRTGELVDDDQDQPPHRCKNGWIDRDADHPVPCLTCKPWLARRTMETSR